MKTLFFFLSILVIGLPFISFGKDSYEILGVPPSASDDEIKKAYLSKARNAHPDTSSLPKAEAERQFKAIQAAWEQIQKSRLNQTKTDLEKVKSKREATDILEKALADGRFGPETIESLPRFQVIHKRSPLSGRSSKDDGEWEAIEIFLRNHQQEILNSKLNEQQLNTLMQQFDEYADLTGSAVQAIRSGITEPFEDAIFQRTSDKNFFISALKERIDRFHRSGVFHLSNAPAEARKESLEKILQLYTQKFASNDSSKLLQLSQELLEHSFKLVSDSPARLHELGSLLRAMPPVLPPNEALSFLGQFMEKLDAFSKTASSLGEYKALKDRAERTIERIFEKNPKLKESYADKMTFWNRLTRKTPQCDRILGNIARTVP